MQPKNFYHIEKLSQAVLDNDIIIVKQMIKNNNGHTNIINEYDQDGLTAIHTAIKGNKQEVLDLLVENNGDIHKATKFGFNGLHIAVINNFVDMSKYLIESGVDKNVKVTGSRSAMYFDYTPLEIAKANENKEVINYLNSLEKITKPRF